MNCPRCNTIIANENRLIVDSCGHQKCRNCFLADVHACMECNQQMQPVVPDNASNVEPTNQQTNHINKVIDSNGKTEYTCTICSKTFYSRTQQYYHKSCGNAAQKKHKCEHCQQCFSTRSHLNYHLQTHSTILHSCSYCQKTFKNPIVLKKHMKQLHAEQAKMFNCSECSKIFKYKSSLTTHLAQHQQNLPFACQLCDKKYAAKAILQQHMLKHCNKQHQCAQCGKWFQRFSTLKLHLKRHAKIECFVCTICNKQFSDASVLLRHSKIHKDCLKYKCLLCDIIISRRDNILRHIRNTHSGESFKNCVQIIENAAVEAKQQTSAAEEMPAMADDCPESLPKTIQNSSVIKSVGNVQPIQIPQINGIDNLQTETESTTHLTTLVTVNLQQEAATAAPVLHKKLKKEIENRALYLKILYPDVDDSEQHFSSAEEEHTIQQQHDKVEQIICEQPQQQQQQQQRSTLLHWRKNVKYTYEHGDF